ncbi:MAG TPA: cation:proton antiporter, partial [Pirellulales bacterium]|nr:cation:proton antiporter [Pirellulales bacterium]
MTSRDFLVLGVQLVVMLVTALALGRVARRFGQPTVLGEMFGGIVLGPTLLGALVPEWHALLFPAGTAAAAVRASIVKFGMLLFLFIVGLEIDLRQLRRNGLAALSIGAIGSLLPLAAGVGAVYLAPDLWHAPADEHRLSYALFVGACMANSANPVLGRILLDLGLLSERIGAVLMSATVIDDLIAWLVLPIVFADFATGGGAAHRSPV